MAETGNDNRITRKIPVFGVEVVSYPTLPVGCLVIRGGHEIRLLDVVSGRISEPVDLNQLSAIEIRWRVEA